MARSINGHCGAFLIIPQCTKLGDVRPKRINLLIFIIMGHGIIENYHQIYDDFVETAPLKKTTATLVRHGRLPQWRWSCFNAKKVRACQGFVMENQDGFLLGYCRRSSRRHQLFCKLKSELSRMMTKPKSSSTVIFKYDAVSYALNFDDGSSKYDPHALHLSSQMDEKPVQAEPGNGYC